MTKYDETEEEREKHFQAGTKIADEILSKEERMRVKKMNEERQNVRDMARLGKTLIDDTTELGKQMIDFGVSVMKMADVIDACDPCNSYVWTNSSNEKERLSIKKVIMYHFGEHL